MLCGDHHYQVLFTRTVQPQGGGGPVVWHDGTLNHHLMNGKVVLQDDEGQVVAEGFEFIQASHKTWPAGHTLEVGDSCTAEIVSFIRASRQDVRPILRPPGIGGLAKQASTAQMPASSSTHSFGRFVLPAEGEHGVEHGIDMQPWLQGQQNRFGLQGNAGIGESMSLGLSPAHTNGTRAQSTREGPQLAPAVRHSPSTFQPPRVRAQAAQAGGSAGGGGGAENKPAVKKRRLGMTRR